MTDISEQEHNEKRKKSNLKIQIDRVHYEVHDEQLTGAQLRAIPDIDITLDRDLFEVVPGQPDRKLDLDDVAEIRNGKRFFTAPATINPGQDWK